ncbi:chloramphenicol acetyltransferase [Roseiterribacter gracilis]|uniref:Acetyltransferase n=1 Tax=Roseiterribacter gracilis TaxID=2812848 RepID=A0A8S8X8W9_9PROT|nr:acetyltransferase [Rhodospirillales bacterium TMPK1]
MMGLIPIEQGQPSNPWIEGRWMTEKPMLHPSAVVQRCRFGQWTWIGANNKLLDSDILDWAYTGDGCDIYNSEVGKFCNIAANVRINPTNHPIQRATLHHFTYRSRSHHMADEDDADFFAWRKSFRTVIGPDVWIGHGALLMSGVKVGTGAIIGAGSVVTKDVPPYTIVVGNPGRIIRHRFDEATQAALERIAWWDWTHDQLKAALHDFRSLDGPAFAAKYDPAEVRMRA